MVERAAVNRQVTGSSPVRGVMQHICKRCLRDVIPNKQNKIHNKNYCQGCLVSVRRNKLKEKAVQSKGGKCQSCGYTKCNRALSFHHIDPSKKLFEVNSNKMFAVSWQRVKDELDKCILLCSNCHAELHDQEILDNYQTL